MSWLDVLRRAPNVVNGVKLARNERQGLMSPMDIKLDTMMTNPLRPKLGADELVNKGMELAGMAPMGIVKLKGGNWLPGSLEQYKRQYKPTAASAQDYYTQELLPKYLRNEAGSADDPLLKNAEEGFPHFNATDDGLTELVTTHYGDVAKTNRRMGGFPEAGIATTNAGKLYEALMDAEITPFSAEYVHNLLRNAQGARSRSDINKLGGTAAEYNAATTVVTNNMVDPVGYAQELAWLKNVDPTTKVHSPTYGQNDMVSNSAILQPLNDFVTNQLNSGLIDPAKMIAGKYTVGQLGRMLGIELRKSSKLLRQLDQTPKIVYTHPSGAYIRELYRPGEFAAESDLMANSMRGYEPTPGHADATAASKGGSADYGAQGLGWEGIKNGKVRALSLRDASNKPIANIELSRDPHLNTWEVSQIQGPGNNPISNKALPALKDWLNANSDIAASPYELNTGGNLIQWNNRWLNRNEAVQQLNELPYKSHEWQTLEDLIEGRI